MNTPAILRLFMSKHGESAGQLASRAGVTQPTLWRILNGESADPKTETLRKIAHAYGITVTQLRGEEPLPGGLRAGKVKGRAALPLTSDERQALEIYRALDARGRRVLLRIAQEVAVDFRSHT
jgi:transcriptional regulator with XRE-family HTH domain